jgi:hypothetical protein
MMSRIRSDLPEGRIRAEGPFAQARRGHGSPQRPSPEASLARGGTSLKNELSGIGSLCRRRSIASASGRESHLALKDGWRVSGARQLALAADASPARIGGARCWFVKLN